MKEFEALLMFFGLAALCVALVVHRQRSGKAYLGPRRSWPVDRAANPGLFLLAQGIWVIFALFCLSCALWILVRPTLQP